MQANEQANDRMAQYSTRQFHTILAHCALTHSEEVNAKRNIYIGHALIRGPGLGVKEEGEFKPDTGDGGF